MSEQKQAYAGKLVQHFDDGDAQDLMVFKYEGSSRFELPPHANSGERALVDRELVYVYENDKWVFDVVDTYGLSTIQQEEQRVELITSTPDPVAGIDFSSKPRKEWTIGNWIAHVGGGIRSDHFVVFGSVMVVDMMVKQILKTHLKHPNDDELDGKPRITVTGGTELQRTTLAAAITGALQPIPVKPGPILQQLNNGGSNIELNPEQFMVVMEAVGRSGGVTVDVVVGKAD